MTTLYEQWPEVVRAEFDSGHGRVRRLARIMKVAEDPEVKLAASTAILAAVMQDEVPGVPPGA